MKIEKPIFIIGAGRSGTTILYKLMSTHPDVCWFSGLTDRYPRFSQLAMIHRILDFPFIGRRLKLNIIKSARFGLGLSPTEAGIIYHSYCGFEHAKKTTEADINKEMEAKFKKVIDQHLRWTGKKRFLSKQTANTQRIRLINEMFPDAHYIHIIRDGRGVASSLFHVNWWNDTDIWWLGHKSRTWEESGNEKIELCALQWKHNVDEILQNKYLFEERYLEIRYEELIEDVKSTFTRITDFCGLARAEKFTELLPATLYNPTHKWKEALTEQQKLILNKTLEESLIQLGYKI
ncbi:MAG: sulfotransferase [Planctomycetes bacterium]|nr:sulfotransferase [Planctomycetota bacterium]